MTRDDLLQDLAYARTLAEEGRQAPLIGGAYLVMFGVLLTICYAAQYLVLTQPGLDIALTGAIWGGFGVISTVGVFALRQRTRALPGGTAIGNRVDRIVWQGAVGAILAVVIGCTLRALFVGDHTAPDAIMAAGFGVYGVALFATAALSGHAWLRAFAWLAWALSGALWFFVGEPWAYLAAAAGAVLVLFVPGIAMMRSEPSKIV